MQINHYNQETKGYFNIEEDGKQLGKMTYSWAGKDRIIINHTEVDPSQQGKGLGKKLVMAAVVYARENNLKIMPLCPYAKKVFDRNEELNDVRF